MTTFRTGLMGLAAACFLTAGSQNCNASLYVFYSTDGGSTFTAVNPGGSPDTGSTTLGSFNFTAGQIAIGTSSFSTNSPGSPVGSFTTNSQLTARNTGTTTAGIEFAIVDNGFTSPTAVGTLANTVTITNNLNVAGNVVTQNACVDNFAAAVSVGSVGGLCGGPGSYSTPTAAATATTPGASVVSNQLASLNLNLSTPFTLVQYFNLNLAAGANVDSVGTVTLSPVAATPEPASLSLLGMGVAALEAVRRRRKSA